MVELKGSAHRSALKLLEQAGVLLSSVSGLLAPDEAHKSATVADFEPARPGSSDSTVVYWAGCRGLARMAREIGYRVDKIGTTTAEADLEARLAVMGRDEYGAWSRDAAGNLTKHDGFSRWIAQAIVTTRPPVHPAITVGTRTIAVALPPDLSRRGFDRALQLELATLALKAHCPDAVRYTAYSIGATRMSMATEFYVGLDPRRDGDRLLTVIEAILVRHDRGRLVDAPVKKASRSTVRETTSATRRSPSSARADAPLSRGKAPCRKATRRTAKARRRG